jgi:hypothetical protein
VEVLEVQVTSHAVEVEQVVLDLLVNKVPLVPVLALAVLVFLTL